MELPQTASARCLSIVFKCPFETFDSALMENTVSSSSLFSFLVRFTRFLRICISSRILCLFAPQRLYLNDKPKYGADELRTDYDLHNHAIDTLVWTLHYDSIRAGLIPRSDAKKSNSSGSVNFL